MSLSAPIAVLADIHGNSLALRAVLDDATRRSVSRFVNLGDSYYGPLDPDGTQAILRDLDMPTVLGNQDRILLEEAERWEGVPAWQATVGALGSDGLERLRALPATLTVEGDILLCHGIPADDMAYLLEDVASGHPVLRDCRAVLADTLPHAAGCSLVLAGHSHLQGRADCDGLTVVNPGAVGLPAYDDDSPPHTMSAGTPHARYALVQRRTDGWHVEFLAVEYDWERAAAMAREGGREDWATWLLTGRAE